MVPWIICKTQKRVDKIKFYIFNIKVLCRISTLLEKGCLGITKRSGGKIWFSEKNLNSVECSCLKFEDYRFFR